MKLIIGLGNPGNEYARTRHNFGWIMLDHIANVVGATWVHKPKFTADIAEYTIDGEKVILVKPTTYYNLSGESIRKIKDFYHIENNDIVTIHDEIALPIGSLRTRRGGSDAGNNGIKSLIAHIGPDFARVRIGSGQVAGNNGDARPTDHRDHVLSRPAASETELLAKLEPQVQHIVSDFIGGTFFETTYSA